MGARNGKGEHMQAQRKTGFIGATGFVGGAFMRAMRDAGEDVISLVPRAPVPARVGREQRSESRLAREVTRRDDSRPTDCGDACQKRDASPRAVRGRRTGAAFLWG